MMPHTCGLFGRVGRSDLQEDSRLAAIPQGMGKSPLPSGCRADVYQGDRLAIFPPAACQTRPSRGPHPRGPLRFSPTPSGAACPGDAQKPCALPIHQKRHARAHQRYRNAWRTLAQVQKVLAAKPTVQVNVAQNQINMTSGNCLKGCVYLPRHTRPSHLESTFLLHTRHRPCDATPRPTP